ncbi:MAG: glycosyltransferase [Acidobacteria bacterium]|nr:MAG: glycosyltransferase [Acidobacteriota bacterium]
MTPDSSAPRDSSGACLRAAGSSSTALSPVRKIALIQRFLPSRSRGGVGHFTHGLANALSARGHAVTVFSQDPAPDAARYDVVRVPVADTRLAPLAFPVALRRCDFRGFDVIHAQGDEQWLSRHGLPPVVRTLHGSSLAEAWFNGVRGRSPRRFALHLYFYLMELIADLRADRVAGVSAGTGRHFPRMHAVVPNGIDVERFASAGRAATKSAAPSIIFMGELVSRKRGAWLVDVFLKTVRARIANAELWLVSPDRSRRADATPANGVHHLEVLDDTDLAARLAQAWVMCLPSAYEGFGRPYAEAMAAGTVAAATPNPGADDVLDRGRAGVLADDASLGAALVAVLGDADRRAELIAIGRRRAAEYDWPHVAARYEALYDEAVAGR